MKFLMSAALALILVSGCKEQIEQKQEDAVVKIITNGQWAVTKYVKGSTDITTDFAGYKFQFKENRTVDAIKNGVTEKTGTWEGNATARTIVSEFQNANQTLTLLNGSWYITDSGLTYVESNQTVAGEARILRLDK